MKELKLYSIYKITNIITSKIYIGQTCQKNPKERFYAHKKVAMGGPEKYPGKFHRIHYSIRKHGADNFTFKILEQCYGLLTSNEIEKYYIELYKTNICRYGNKYGYNMTDGGDGNSGHITSDETRKKQSDAKAGKYVGEKSPLFGIPKTEEHRKNISIGKTGIPSTVIWTDEMRKEWSIANTGENNPQFERPPSKETREKQSVAMKKVRASKKSEPHTNKTLLEISVKHKQKKNKIIPQKIKNKIIKLIDNGLKTRKQICEIFDLSIHTVNSIFRNKNKIPKEINIITINEQNKVMKLKNDGYEYIEIGKMLGIKTTRVRDAAQKYRQRTGVPERINKNSTTITYKDIIPQIHSLFDQNLFTKRQLAEKFNISFNRIKVILKLPRSQ
jgi:group I intron endonuclease